MRYVPNQNKLPLRHATGIGWKCSNQSRLHGNVFRTAIRYEHISAVPGLMSRHSRRLNGKSSKTRVVMRLGADAPMRCDARTWLVSISHAGVTLICTQALMPGAQFFHRTSECGAVDTISFLPLCMTAQSVKHVVLQTSQQLGSCGAVSLCKKHDSAFLMLWFRSVRRTRETIKVDTSYMYTCKRNSTRCPLVA
jgi:hypothetical protein